MSYNGTTQTAAYNGDGLRTWKQKGAATTRTYYLYDGSVPVCEFSSTGALTATNTFAGSGLVSRRVGSTTTYYAFDERGNVAQRMSAAGAVVSSDLYDGYGARTSTVAVQPDPFGYGAQSGYYTDVETGLVLCTHRYYDPAAGRFVTRDPMGYEGGDNLYTYCGNDPVDGIDPEGLATVVYNRKNGTITVYDDNGKKVVGPYPAGDPGIVKPGTYGIGPVDWLRNPITGKPTSSGAQRLHDLSGPDPKGRTRAGAMGDVAIFLDIPDHGYRIHHARNPKKTHGCIGSTNQGAVDDTATALKRGHKNTIIVR